MGGSTYVTFICLHLCNISGTSSGQHLYIPAHMYHKDMGPCSDTPELGISPALRLFPSHS